MRIAFLFLFLSPAFLNRAGTTMADHKFYVSTTIVEENQFTGSLEITLKLFTDDLEFALKGLERFPLNIGFENQHPQAEVRVKEYVLANFDLSFNDKDGFYTLHYVGMETENDLTFVYFEISPIPEFQVLKVKNTIFHELFDEQVNIVHLRFSGWTQRLMIDKMRPEQIISR